MFYPEGDYMRDIVYYGQNGNLANSSSMCPYNMNANTSNMMDMGRMGMPNNPFPPNCMGNCMMRNQNTNPNCTATEMYPKIYKIILPVAVKVIQNSNYQFLTEEVLNNMVDTVFNIVDGDMSSLESENEETRENKNEMQNSNTSNTTSVTGIRRETVQKTAEVNVTRTSVKPQEQSIQLRKDVIKIIMIKELTSRQTRQMPVNNFTNTYQNPYQERMPYYY